MKLKTIANPDTIKGTESLIVIPALGPLNSHQVAHLIMGEAVTLGCALYTDEEIAEALDYAESLLSAPAEQMIPASGPDMYAYFSFS